MILNKIGIKGTLKTNLISFRKSPSKRLTTKDNMKQASTPQSIPKGIAITPRIKPSYKTFFLICLFVAPTLTSIPYCLVFSIIEILKLLRITKMLVTIIIPITTPAIA